MLFGGESMIHKTRITIQGDNCNNEVGSAFYGSNKICPVHIILIYLYTHTHKHRCLYLHYCILSIYLCHYINLCSDGLVFQVSGGITIPCEWRVSPIIKGRVLQTDTSERICSLHKCFIQERCSCFSYF